MKQKAKNNLVIGFSTIFAFIVWTCLLKVIDVKLCGVNGTKIGFATINIWFFKNCGVHMVLYTITDWAGLLPILIVVAFGIVGFIQLVTRKSLIKVDYDLLILGIYYIIVFAVYILFENVIINFRPILINGFMEKSYPSSTTLLAMSIILTLIEQISRRCKNKIVKSLLLLILIMFLTFMIVARLISGVHWLTDIIGAMIFCVGLFYVYYGFILLLSEKQSK